MAGQLVTLSHWHVTFQTKKFGNYVPNEIRYGGDNYVATGRGLLNERKLSLDSRMKFSPESVEMSSHGEGTLECDLDESVVVDFGAGEQGENSGCSSKASTNSVFHDLLRWRLEGSNDEKQVKRSKCTLPNARNAQACVCPVQGAKVGNYVIDTMLYRCIRIWSPTRLSTTRLSDQLSRPPNLL